MKIMDFLNQKSISANLKAVNKEEAIRELVELLVKSGEIRDKEKLIKALFDRESLGSTGIGQGVAIPHSKSEGVRELTAAFGVSKRGVNFDSLDGEPAYLFFLLVAPEDTAGPHLKALARISKLLRDKHFRDALRAAKDEKTLLKVIIQEDQKP